MGLDSSVSPSWCSTAPLPFQQSRRGPAHKSCSKKRGCTKGEFYCTSLKHLYTMKIECSEERINKGEDIKFLKIEWQSKGGLDLSRRCHSLYDRFLQLQLQRQ